MDDPRTNRAPKDHMEAIRAFARDFAYGVMIGDWLPDIVVRILQDFSWNVANRRKTGEENLFREYFNEKWNEGDSLPNLALLELFGYFEHIEGNYKYEKYRVTDKALDLLTQPALPPQVFIAYARKESSAFALLIEARLAAKGIGTFIDKQIDLGDDWKKSLEETIKERVDYFICLIAPGTMNRHVIQEEIRWAFEAQDTRNLRLIPIWHNNFTDQNLEGSKVDQDIRDFVTSTNAIKITDESAQGYETGLNLLLNRLEYR